MPTSGAADLTSHKQPANIPLPATTSPTHPSVSTTSSTAKPLPTKDRMSSHPDSNKKDSFTKRFFSGLKLILISLVRLLGFIYACAVNLFSKSSKDNRFEKWNLANGHHPLQDINANPNYLVPDLKISPNYIPDLVKYYRQELDNAQTDEALRILREEFTAFYLQFNSATRLTIERAIASTSSGNTSPSSQPTAAARTSSSTAPSSSSALPMNRFIQWEDKNPTLLITDIVEYFGTELIRANDQPSITQLFDEFDVFVSQLDHKETVIVPLNVKLGDLRRSFSDEKNTWITTRLSPKKTDEKPPQITNVLSMLKQLGNTNSPVITQALQTFGLTPDMIRSMKQQASELMEQGQEITEKMMQQLRESDSTGAIKTLQRFGLTPDMIESIKQQASKLNRQEQDDPHPSSGSDIPLD